MQRTNHRSAKLLMLGLVVLTGCASTSGQKPAALTMPSSLLPAASEAKAEGGELPARETVKACLATAQQLEQQGHLREARLLYEKARTLDPKAAAYSRILGTLYEREGDLAKAQTEYAAALQATPKDADLLNDIGYVHYRQGNWAEAEQRFRQAIAVAPQHERATVNLGQALAQQGKLQEAFEAFAKVVGPAAAHSNVGAILAKQGRTAESQHAFRNALALNPSLPQPQAFLAYFAQQPKP